MSHHSHHGHHHQTEQEKAQQIRDAAAPTQASAVSIVHAVQAGDPVTNEQITGTLAQANKTISNLPDANTKYGQRAASDVQNVLTEAQRFLEEKNSGDLFQTLILHVKEAAAEAKLAARDKKEDLKDMAADVGDIAVGGGRRVAGKARDITESLKHLAVTLVESSEFRQLVINLIELFQGIVEETVDRVQEHNPQQVLTPLSNFADQRSGQIQEIVGQTQQFATQVGQQVLDHAQNVGQQAYEHAQNVTHQVADHAQNVGQQVTQHAQNVSNQVADHAQYVGQQVGNLSQDVAQKVGDHAQYVGQQAQNLGNQVGDQVSQLGDQIQYNADTKLPSSNQGYGAQGFGTGAYGGQTGGAVLTPVSQTPVAATFVDPVTGAPQSGPYLGTQTTYIATQQPSGTYNPNTYGQTNAAQNLSQVADFAQTSGQQAAQTGQNIYQNTKDVAGDVASTTKDVAYDVANQTKGVATDLAQQTKGVATDVANQTKDVAQDLANQTKDVATDVANQTKAVAADIQDQTKAVVQDIQNQAQEFKQTVGAQAKEIAQDFKGAVQETGHLAKQVGNELLQDFRQYGIPIDPAKRREVVDHFFLLWDQIIQNPDFERAVQALFDIFDEFRSRVTQLSEYASAQLSGGVVPKLRSADLVWIDVREIISRWTGRAQLDGFLSDVNEYINTVRNDPEINQVFFDFREYVSTTIDQPALLKDPAHQEIALFLFDRFYDSIARWQYNAETEYILAEFRALLESIRHDETTRRLNEATMQLGRDLILDERGHVNFRVTQDVLDSLRQMILPIFLDQFANVPLPKIESSDEEVDMVIENLSFPGSTLLPEQFEITAKQHLQVQTAAGKKSKADAKVTLAINNLQGELKDIHFTFKKKHGIVKLSDHGSVNVAFGGPNARILIKWTVDNGPNSVKFTTKKVFVRLDNLKIHINEAKHDVLLPMVTGMFHNTIKHRVEKELAETIMTKLMQFDNKLNALALDAAHKQAALERKVSKAIDHAVHDASAAVDQARVKVNELQDRANQKYRQARRSVRRQFRSGQGRNLKERAHDAFYRAQYQVNQGINKVQGAYDTAQGAVNTAQQYVQGTGQPGDSFSTASQPGSVREGELLGSGFGTLSTPSIPTSGADFSNTNLLEKSAPAAIVTTTVIPLEPATTTNPFTQPSTYGSTTNF